MKELDKKMKLGKNILSISGYFFILKRKSVFNDSFDSKFTTDKIAATSLSSKKEADMFHRLLKSEGLQQGKDFVDGICSEKDGLAYFPNDWLEFMQIDGKCYVKGL